MEASTARINDRLCDASTQSGANGQGDFNNSCCPLQASPHLTKCSTKQFGARVLGTKSDNFATHAKGQKPCRKLKST